MAASSAASSSNSLGLGISLFSPAILVRSTYSGRYKMSKLSSEARNRAWSSCRAPSRVARQSLARGGEIECDAAWATWSEPAGAAKPPCWLTVI